MPKASNIIAVFLLAAAAASATGDNDVCFTCKCREAVINCGLSDLNYQPTLGEYANKTIELDLSGLSISKVEVFQVSTSLSKLSFKHNRIHSVKTKAFENLYNITVLDLSHNFITSEILTPIVFKGPELNSGILSLKVLNLASNTLHTIHQDMFEFLPDLEELYLASNPFKVLDHGTLVALSSIHKIKILDLTSTQLNTVPSGWLNAAINLEVLNLSSNNMTTVPVSLEEARSLRHLILDDNHIKVISSFPKLPKLEILEINWMPNLYSIKDHALVNLIALKELYISNNNYLYEISEDALVEPGSYDIENREGAVYPPLRKLVLSQNRLRYLGKGLLERWDQLTQLNLESNPWVCDCDNQWMISTLIPLMSDKKLGATETLICGEPVEMKGISMLTLAMRNYKMRCLDLYGNEPDRDAKVLIIVLVVVLVAIPVSLLFLHIIKRPKGQTGYPTAYYRRAQSFESIN